MGEYFCFLSKKNNIYNIDKHHNYSLYYLNSNLKNHRKNENFIKGGCIIFDTISVGMENVNYKM